MMVPISGPPLHAGESARALDAELRPAIGGGERRAAGGCRAAAGRRLPQLEEIAGDGRERGSAATAPILSSGHDSVSPGALPGAAGFGVGRATGSDGAATASSDVDASRPARAARCLEFRRLAGHGDEGAARLLAGHGFRGAARIDRRLDQIVRFDANRNRSITRIRSLCRRI